MLLEIREGRRHSYLRRRNNTPYQPGKPFLRPLSRAPAIAVDSGLAQSTAENGSSNAAQDR